MLEVIVCTNCGTPIGNLIDLVDFAVDHIKRDWIATDMPNAVPDRVQWDPKWSVELAGLFDELHVNLECCRIALMAKIKISKLH